MWKCKECQEKLRVNYPHGKKSKGVVVHPSLRCKIMSSERRTRTAKALSTINRDDNA